jgi:glycopeptide antibiotics resistance protein
MAWINSHLLEIGVAVTLAIQLGQTVARWTKTEKDDLFWGKVHNLAKVIGLYSSKDA